MADRGAPADRRPRIAFFDYPDVFEDFYPHYGVDQEAFARSWAASGNHRWVSLLQAEIGDVTWYSFSLDPVLDEARHEVTGARVRMIRSPLLHRVLWRSFYLPSPAWRWRRHFHKYELVASYTSLASVRVLRTLRREAPDLLFLQDYSSGRFDLLLALGRLLGIPVVAYHGGGWRWVAAPIKRRTLGRTDLLLASSAGERDRLAAEMNVSPERVRVVLTPIDTEALQPIDRREACRLAALDYDRRYLVFVGRLDDKVKQVGALIRAFADASVPYPDASLLITGDGPDRTALERLATELAPGRTTFTGWVDQEALRPLLCSAECLVLPSLHEGFPSVVGEALACGTPVMGSRTGGIPELVIPGVTGWLFEPGDGPQLTAVVARVLEQRDEVRGMRAAARRIAEQRVSPAAVGAALDELLPIQGLPA